MPKTKTKTPNKQFQLQNAPSEAVLRGQFIHEEFVKRFGSRCQTLSLEWAGEVEHYELEIKIESHGRS